MKIVKRLLIFVLIAAIIAGGVYGGYYWKNSHVATVSVYEVTELAETDYWEDANESYGSVTTDRVQTVFLSSTQKVEEIKVQEVKPEGTRDQDRLGGHGTHFPHEHEDTSKCGESITENELETGRKTFVQPRL